MLLPVWGEYQLLSMSEEIGLNCTSTVATLQITAAKDVKAGAQTLLSLQDLAQTRRLHRLHKVLLALTRRLHPLRKVLLHLARLQRTVHAAPQTATPYVEIGLKVLAAPSMV